MNKIILVYGCLSLFFLTSCDELKNNETIKNSKDLVYQEFVDALNTGDSIKIKEQIVKHWSDTLIGENNRWLTTDLNYWLAANKEFGGLKFVSLGKDTFNNNQVAWLKGITTKDWVGLEFDFDTNNRVLHTNVLRSCTPSNYDETNLEFAENSYSELLKNYFEESERQDLFSGMVLVAKGDSIIYEGFHGYANKEHTIRISPKNKMVIASTTKMFTAVAIAQLVESNLLDLHQPISNYLDDFPTRIGSKVTTAHLLTHTSGIELDEIDGFMNEIRKARSVVEFYNINLKYLPALENYNNFNTLNNHDYSNENFDILGRLIEVVSNEDFYSYLEKKIFKPLNMNSTGPIDMSTDLSFVTKNYQINRTKTGKLDEGFRDEVPASDLSISRPAGSFYSTPQDLYKFMKALNSNTILNTETTKEFVSRRVENLTIPIYKSWYGYGFYINERFGKENYGHAGGIPGVSSRCEYYPENDIYVIVISNYN